MTKIPQPIHSIAALIDASHEGRAESPRGHLGCSLLGHPCERWLWLSFRWAVKEKFPGRILRLFRRGQNEEATIIEDLKRIGVKFSFHQEFVDLGSHVGGSTDGTIESGVPGAEKARHVAEFKTHSKQSFSDLLKKEVKASKPQHWAQVQLYMLGTGIKRALYLAVCKDDDRIYTERVKFDKEAAEALRDRGHRVALSDRMPDPLSSDPSWYQCKWCPAHSFCFERQMTKQVNCRTCAHATAEKDSTWSCARWSSKDIPLDFQATGCDSHVLHPDMVPWNQKDSADPHEAVYEIAGKDVRNGEGDAFTFSSKELIVGGEACANELVGKVRETFPGAAVVGVTDATP
tara:strand:+ start:3322 stop:4359 length:1038 start_codon:yes stop_codon:yes gene_type:complete